MTAFGNGCTKREIKIIKWSIEIDVYSFLIGIHSMQGWTATRSYGVTRKRSTKRLKHIGNLFWNILQLKGVSF